MLLRCVLATSLPDAAAPRTVTGLPAVTAAASVLLLAGQILQRGVTFACAARGGVDAVAVTWVSCCVASHAAAAAGGPARRSSSPPREGATAAAAPEKTPGPSKEEAAEGPPDSRQPSGLSAATVEAETEQPQKCQQQESQHQDADSFVPPFPDIPPNMCLPESLREYLVVERTAHFVREVGRRKP